MNKANNTGFSLVEIIVVIAIMAIITAAGAPQLMKTIEKKRISTDIQICKTIETCVNTALTNDKVWDDVAHNWNSDRDLYFYVKRDEASGNLFFKGIATDGNFRKELEPMLVNLKNPQQTGKKSYKVYVTLETNTKYDDDGNITDKTYTVKGIDVSTADYEITDDTQYIFSTESESQS